METNFFAQIWNSVPPDIRLNPSIWTYYQNFSDLRIRKSLQNATPFIWPSPMGAIYLRILASQLHVQACTAYLQV